MRLKQEEIEAIKEIFLQTFQRGKIRLFGSRIHDDKRGGDIDLYIETPVHENLQSKKIDFLVRLKRRIGDRKIDVVIARDGKRLIDKIAREEGIVLCQCI